MSMVINLVEDHNIYLCEGGPVYNGGVSPTPITYLTQWKIVGNSEVHTLPYPDGVVLPTGYKRCKYLEFHGTEYFESGVASKQGIGMTFQFKTSTKERFIAGVRNGHTSDSDSWKSTFVFGFLNTSSLIVSYGDYMQDVASTNYADGVKHTVVLDDTTAKVDSTNITLTRGTIATSFNIPIGSLRSLNIIDTRMYVGYLYNFVLYDANDTLFNGIPCLDDNDVPCLYDTVSGNTFYNQGTGTFGYELYPQPTEIWSCGEYNATDGKYHILVQPQGGSIVDIALNRPLRKLNGVADTVVYPHPSGVSNAAMVSIFLMPLSTHKLIADIILTDETTGLPIGCRTTFTYISKGKSYTNNTQADILCNKIKNVLSIQDAINHNGEFIMVSTRTICVRNTAIEQTLEAYQSYFDSLGEIEIIYPLKTPYNVDLTVSQIEEADSYSCVISQGGKAVSWSEFLYYSGYLLTDSENNILVDSENYQLTVQN